MHDVEEMTYVKTAKGGDDTDSHGVGLSNPGCIGFSVYLTFN